MTNTASADWAHRVQSETLLHAEAYGEPWTPDELELVLAFTDDATDEELAITLGRSLYAIWAIQHRARVGDVDLDAARRQAARKARQATPPTCPTHHIALTATGDCDWC